MSGNNNKQFALNQILWIGVSFGISIAISMLVPFPLSLVTIIAVFILLNFYMRKRMMINIAVNLLGRRHLNHYQRSLYACLCGLIEDSYGYKIESTKTQLVEMDETRIIQ